jgi:hypothetical protein
MTMFIHRRGNLTSICVGLIFAGATALTACEARANEQPAHVAWGELLIATVLPSENEYGSKPSFIRWEGDSGHNSSGNRTVCATFVTLLLQRAYAMESSDFTAWMGTGSPNAAAYHDAIVAENGFERITNVNDIAPGDLIAIEYPSASGPTGHVAIVTAPPLPHPAKAPLVAGTQQFEVLIIDSTSSPHGQTDSRVKADGTVDAGAGSGSMRLYTNLQGDIVGHAWSTCASDGFHNLSSRHLVVGRLARDLPSVVEP